MRRVNRRRSKKYPKCKSTGKVRFPTQIDAMMRASLWIMRAGMGFDKRRMRAYKCDMCGGWHLTSAKKRTHSRAV
jgi:hypothetical protein